MSRKRYQRKFVLHGQSHVIISLWWYRLAAFIVNQKWKNKICKLGKVDDRIQEQKTKINRDMNWERWF